MEKGEEARVVALRITHKSGGTSNNRRRQATGAQKKHGTAIPYAGWPMPRAMTRDYRDRHSHYKLRRQLVSWDFVIVIAKSDRATVPAFPMC